MEYLTNGPSPYTVGMWVPPKRFHGYKQQLRSFFCNILTAGDTLQPILIIGVRRSGKTSFLKFLTLDEELKRELLGEKAEKLLLPYLDLARIQSEEQFFIKVANAISEFLPSKIDDDTYISLHNGDEFFDWLKLVYKENPNIHIAILLDEFDQLFRSPEIFTNTFFSHLRAIASNFPNFFTWVITSSEKLSTLEARSTGYSLASPFWNIFQTIILDGFDKEDAISLICNPSLTGEIPWNNASIEYILELSGRFPFVIQAVSQEMLKHIIKEGLTIDTNDVSYKCSSEVITCLLSRYSMLSSVFGQYIMCQSIEKQNILIGLADEKIPEGNPFELRELAEIGFIDNSKEQPTISGELFKQYIITQKKSNIEETMRDSKNIKKNNAEINVVLSDHDGEAQSNINIIQINQSKIDSLETLMADNMWMLEEKTDSISDELKEKTLRTISEIPDTVKNYELDKVKGYLKDPEMGLNHKFKLSIPIIPYLLHYEIELNEDIKVNLKQVWHQLIELIKEM